jgi:hypothetical protein
VWLPNNVIPIEAGHGRERAGEPSGYAFDGQLVGGDRRAQSSDLRSVLLAEWDRATHRCSMASTSSSASTSTPAATTLVDARSEPVNRLIGGREYDVELEHVVEIDVPAAMRIENRD